MKLQGFLIENILSLDGTKINYRRIGSGPSLIIIPGSARMAKHYDELARYLSSTFTVYTIERRGRGNSGAQSDFYSMKKEQQDVKALLEKTNAQYMFGHSYGGLIALEVALIHPIEKLALYEPSVSIDGSLQIKWVEDFENALSQKNYHKAEKIFLKGVGVDFPEEQLESYINFVSQSPEWNDIVRMMPTIPNECREVCRLDSAFSKYQKISANTLFMHGTEGAPTDLSFNNKALQALKSVILNFNTLNLQGLDHNAPDMHAPQQIAQILNNFFN